MGRGPGHAARGRSSSGSATAGEGPPRECANYRGRTFEAYVEQFLVPELRPGDIVVMDNLSSHKRPKVAALIEAAGASLLYLPP